MFPCLQDNYGYLVHDDEASVTAAIDTPDAAAILAAARGARLAAHAHPEHASPRRSRRRQPRAQAANGLPIVGPRADAGRIPGIDVQVGDGDSFELGSHRVEVFDTPGHTRGHIVYWLRGRRSRVRRRHAVRDGLRAAVRGDAGADVELAAEDRALAGAHTPVLRARVHAKRTVASRSLSSRGNRALAERMQDVCTVACGRAADDPDHRGAGESDEPVPEAGRAATCKRRSGSWVRAEVEVFAKTRALKDAF